MPISRFNKISARMKFPRHRRHRGGQGRGPGRGALIPSLALILFLAPLTSAAWTLTDSHFNRKQIDPVSIDSAGIHFTASATSQPDTVAWDDVLEITRGDSRTSLEDLTIPIKPGDALNLTIVDLQGENTGPASRSALVGTDGNIALPYLPAEHAAGLTLLALHDAIVKAYQNAKMIEHPDITITIERAKPTTAADGSGFTLCLTTGDRLAGAPAGVEGDALKWNIPSLSGLKFSLSRIAAVAAPGVAPSDLDQPRTDDMVILANGDKTHGIITDIQSSGVTIQAGDATPTLKWDAVKAVYFSTPPKSPLVTRMFRIRFSGDNSLLCQSVALAGAQFTFSVDGKSTLSLPLESVGEIEQVNGPVSWLTSRSPVENIYRPYFTENFPTRFDRTVDNAAAIRERYPDFHHGIGCHSYSKLVYGLDGNYTTFRTQFAIDDESNLADVTIRVLLDDTPAVEKKNIKAGQIYPVITVPLAGAKTLALEVDYGENYSTEDRFVWLDPALVK